MHVSINVTNAGFPLANILREANFSFIFGLSTGTIWN